MSRYLSLAELSHPLVPDEGHRNRMAGPESEQWVRPWRREDHTVGLPENGSVVCSAVAWRRSVRFGAGLAKCHTEGNRTALEQTLPAAEGRERSLSMNSI